MAETNCAISTLASLTLTTLLALDSAGSSIAARMAMMPMTTSSSISVNARRMQIGICEVVCISDVCLMCEFKCYVRVKACPQA